MCSQRTNLNFGLKFKWLLTQLFSLALAGTAALLADTSSLHYLANTTMAGGRGERKRLTHTQKLRVRTPSATISRTLFLRDLTGCLS